MALSQKDIYKLLTVQDKIVRIADETIEGIHIQNDEYKAKFVNISNSTFEGLFLLENLDLSISLILENCKFNAPVILKNLKAQGYNEIYNPNSQSIVFKDCSFSSPFQLSGKKTTFERQLLFDGCIFSDGLEIDGAIILAEGLTIRGCVIDKKLDLFHIEAKQDISIAANVINVFARIENSRCSTLTILGQNIFAERLHVQNCDFERGIIFNDGVFKRETYITLVKTGKTGLEIFGSTF